MRTILFQKTVNKMKKLLGFSLILIILPLVFLRSSISIRVSENEKTTYILKSTVQYINPQTNLFNVWNFTEREDDRTVGLFMNSSWQTVKLLNSTFPVEKFKNDSDGNPTAVLQFPQAELSAGQNLSFVTWYEITTLPRTIPNIAESESGKLDNIDASLVSAYTGNNGPWQTDNSALRQLAFSLKGNETKVLPIVDNFIKWIVNHIVYPKTSHEVPYYPSETYSKLEGDCDDQAMLLIALSRIVGIPAYLQLGSIYLPQDPVENDTYWNKQVTYIEKYVGWHGWAMVYVPPWGWLPVDLTYVYENPKDNPLNAIKFGAITEPTAAQYANVTNDDYVASSLETRSFIIQNGFKVFAEDEMLLGKGQESPQVLTVPPTDWTLIAFAVIVVLLIGVSIFVARKRIKP